MQLLHSRNPWHYCIDFNILVDFCIWVLQVDGLHVPPFDQHPDGDGSLRAAGLTGADWQTWFLQVLQQSEAFQRALLQSASQDPFNSSAMPARQIPMPQIPMPPSVWSGNDAVRARLFDLWEEYGPAYNQRKRREPELARALRKQEQRTSAHLYDELRPYHTRIPPLTIYLVDYEQPLDCLIPPATLLMTLQEGQPQPEDFRERVLAAAAALATKPDQRKRKSLFTRAGASFAYREHVRKPVFPLPPPRQAIPSLADAGKQAILDELGDENAYYGLVDLTTVRFLREKQRPGWQFHEVLFQEIDGEQRRFIFLLQQTEDGSWHHSSSSNSSDLQNEWPSIVAPVRDHPLIFLSFSSGGNANGRYRLTAYGDVIDNGFHVERVQLVTATEQILEDAVEQGMVFFVHEQSTPIPMSFQVKLYNTEGKLVWQQTEPQSGLPPWFKR